MNDVLGSISVIRNFIGNSSRLECNDVLYKALGDAVDCMELRIPDKVLNHSKIDPNRKGRFCPSCSAIIKHHEERPYSCSVCGKALDWE